MYKQTVIPDAICERPLSKKLNSTSRFTEHMKTINLPYLALALCLFLLTVVTWGSKTGSDGDTRLPLLTLLIFNECAFLLAVAGAFIGIKYLRSINFRFGLNPLYSLTTLLCTLLIVQFTLLGIQLWPL
jgi:hypothetical protein